MRLPVSTAVMAELMNWNPSWPNMPVRSRGDCTGRGHDREIFVPMLLVRFASCFGIDVVLRIDNREENVLPSSPQRSRSGHHGRALQNMATEAVAFTRNPMGIIAPPGTRWWLGR